MTLRHVLAMHSRVYKYAHDSVNHLKHVKNDLVRMCAQEKRYLKSSWRFLSMRADIRCSLTMTRYIKVLYYLTLFNYPPTTSSIIPSA